MTFAKTFYYNATQSIFTVIKILCALFVSLSNIPPLGTTDVFLVSSFTFSGMSYSWNHTVYALFRLAYFT